MTENRTILLIDDDPLIHKIITMQIGKHYTLVHAHSGAEGLEQLDKIAPCLVLLDIEMKEMSGYLVCEQIRANRKFDHVGIIFLTVKSNQADMLLGYELGADDYIVKPFHIDTLKQKIETLRRLPVRNIRQTKQSFPAQDETLNTLAEFKQVMGFIEATYSINFTQTLASQFLNLVGSLGLNCSVLLCTVEGDKFFSGNATTSPLEMQLLQTSKNKTQFIDFGFRSIVSYPRVSVLIKNMPLDAPEKYQHYRTLFPAMIGAMDAKVAAIMDHDRFISQSNQLTTSFNEIRNTLVNMAVSLNDNNSFQKEHLALLTGQLNSCLEVIQENRVSREKLTATFTKTLAEIRKINQEYLDLDKMNKELATVLLTMKKMVDQHENLVVSIQRDSKRLLQTHDTLKEERYQGDIELF